MTQMKEIDRPSSIYTINTHNEMDLESLTVGQDQSLWNKRSLESPEGAMLCERPLLVLPLTHEEQIHCHGLTVLPPHNAALEKHTMNSQHSCLRLSCSSFLQTFTWTPWAPLGTLTSTCPSCRPILNPRCSSSNSSRARPFTPVLIPL